MEKGNVLNVEKIVEQGKAILTGEALPKTSEGVKSTLESISTEVEQVRYAEGEKLSSAGQAVLKDLEEILVGGAEVTAAIPPETFLHAARAQQKVAEAAVKPEEARAKLEGKAEEVEEVVVMNMAKLLRMLFTSNEFRDVVTDWSAWLKSAIIVQLEEAQKSVETAFSQKSVETATKEVYEGVGQVPVESVSMKEKVQSVVPEIKDEQLDKMISMFEWMQERQEYQEAVGYVFNQFSNLSNILGIEEGEEGVVDKEKLKEAGVEIRKAGLDTLKAVENWTHRSTEDLQDHLRSTANHLKSDDRLRSSIQSLAHFFANCFNEPGFLNDRQWIRDEARDRVNEVREAIGEGYKKDFRGLADESRELIKSLDREPRTAHLKQSLKKLLEDVFVAGDEGTFSFKTELLGDLGVIVSGLLHRAKHLHVPDLEIHDEDLDFVARNIILDAGELVPQQFKATLVTENMAEKMRGAEEGRGTGVLTEEEKERVFVDLEPLEASQTPSHASHASQIPADTWQTRLKFEVKGIHGHCRDIHFNVRKRTGFPQLTDEGLADLRVWGPRGMLVKVVVRPEWVREETVERTIHTKEIIGTFLQ